MRFSEVLKALRHEYGLSQEDVAAYMGVTQAAISQYEGDSTLPRPARIVALARVLGINPRELLVRSGMLVNNSPSVESSGSNSPVVRPGEGQRRELVREVTALAQVEGSGSTHVGTVERPSPTDVLSGDLRAARMQALGQAGSEFSAGDVVVLPWGLDELEGRIVEVDGRQATVEVVVAGTLGGVPHTEKVRYPVHALRALESSDTD